MAVEKQPLYKNYSMKKIIVFFATLIFCNIFCQKIILKTTTQIIYNFEFKADSTKADITNDILTLYIGDKFSIFQNDKKFKIDSLIAIQPVFQMSTRPLYKVSHVIYKDLNKSEQIYSDKIENINFGYKEIMPLFEWKTTNNTKYILNYKCYSAETNFRGRKFIAWYTNEIPISDGPYKFSGLPGLVLEAYDNKDNFHYSLLAIINKNKNLYYDQDIKYIERRKMIEARINNIKKYVKGEIRVNPLEKK